MARIHTAALIVALIALAGCATQSAPAPRIITQRVEIPVQVRRDVPGELLTCTDDLPVPMLEDAPGGLFIAFDQIPRFTQMIAGLARCDAAWRVWVSAP